MAIGFYLNQVVKHQFGTSRSCCFCLQPNRLEQDDEANDMIVEEGENIEPVDDETRRRPGVCIKHISKEFPGNGKKAPPVVAVDDFSCAM